MTPERESLQGKYVTARRTRDGQEFFGRVGSVLEDQVYMRVDDTLMHILIGDGWSFTPEPEPVSGSLQEVVVRNVVRLRLAQGWGQHRLATEASRVGRRWFQQMVQRMEAGTYKLGVDDMAQLAAAFGVQVSELMTEPS